ncbi:MAG: Holliday junction branch migration protein RuvA [Paludibacteraceae bacterium]|nr:Holliday junction branch migration protein RuvA [Paludibacteraceae bacterium]
MIDYIRGSLTELNPALAVIDAAGVGYAINIALPTYSFLQPLENKEVKLFITEIIREDTHDLYGFPSKGERSLFELLLTVSGIGANTARMIMSAFSAGEVRQIIATGNARQLSQVKGLGPKTAQRVIVDLKDKVLKIDLGMADKPETGISDSGTSGHSPVRDEAVSALTMLGFAQSPTAKAVDKILQDSPAYTVEQVIRLALKML